MAAVVEIKYKYEKEILGVVAITGRQCPPAAAVAVAHEAYRYVQSPISEGCFLPQGLKKPQRIVDASDHAHKCSLLGLSMFNTESAAREHYAGLKQSFKNIGKALGTHLAKGELQDEDGVATPIGRGGHFDFYELSTVILQGRFTVIGEI